MAKISPCVVEENSIGSNTLERKRRPDHTSGELSRVKSSEQGGSCDDNFLGYSDEFDDEICSKKLKREVKSDDESCALAEPLIRCAWSGDFDVRYYESIYYPRRIYSFNAFVSSKACQKVRDAAASFGEVLNFEILPAATLWPKSFRQSGPTGDDIALYFFPPLPLHEPLYDALILEMIAGDLAMQAFVHNSELLIFTSDELPTQCEKFQGKYFLWGVFRSRNI
ncbi:hypothetical protein ACS0TY_010228 [Phlomoides rotata]